MLELSHIKKTFQKGTVDETILFQDFALTVEDGDFVSIVGSNGSGKTTMLSIICGSTGTDGGEILLKGMPVNGMPQYKRAEKIGRVFQDPAKGTCPSMTILENIALAENKGKFFGLGRGVMKQKIDLYKEELKRLRMGLEDRIHVKTGSLSGGQRQALALLLSTWTPIDLLILDEHTAALDPTASETVMALTDEIVQSKKVTTLMVTHNLKYAVRYGTRLIMMDKGHTVIDVKGPEKDQLQVDQILKIFNEISVECGN